MIGIIDYDAGNIKSVEKALHYLGEETVVSRDPQVLLKADKVILPGVGSFGQAMENLHTYGLVPVIHEMVEKKTPFLGICLGLQLLFESSEETPGVEGLGILKGRDREDSSWHRVLRFRIWDGIPCIYRTMEDYLRDSGAGTVCVFCTFLLSAGRRSGDCKSNYRV